MQEPDSDSVSVSVVDTGEFLVEESGFQQAVVHAREQQQEIETLRNLVYELVERLHDATHTTSLPIWTCQYLSCRRVRSVLEEYGEA